MTISISNSRFHFTVVRASLCMVLLVPFFGFGQNESVDEDADIRRKYERAHSAWVVDNITPWVEPIREDPPASFYELTDVQRNMMRGEPNAPDIEYVGLLMEQMNLKSGDTLVDFGCGMGQVESLLLTNGVPPVHVFGMDIDAFALDMAPRVIDWTFAFLGFYNASQKVLDAATPDTLAVPHGFRFHPILIQEGNAGFPNKGTQHLMCMRTLHHLPQEAIEQMVSLVRTGGRIYIVDSIAEKSGKTKCRDGEVTFYLTRDEIVERMESAGCTLVEEITLANSGGLFVFEI